MMAIGTININAFTLALPIFWRFFDGLTFLVSFLFFKLDCLGKVHEHYGRNRVNFSILGKGFCVCSVVVEIKTL